MARAARKGRKCFRRDERGTTAIEFSVLAIPFFFTLFAILETALIFLAGLSLDHAVDATARLVRTGQMNASTMDHNRLRSTICGNAIIISSCSGLQIDLRVIHAGETPPEGFDISSGSLHGGDFSYEVGQAGEVSVLRAAYAMPLITSVMHRYFSNLDGNAFLISTSTAFQIEEYDAAN